MDWRDIPSLAALRAFEAAARLESYSAAARELNVTHAAIAQHVRALEDRFGQSLMARAGRGMAPTGAGARLAEDLGRGFSEIAAGVRALDDAKGTGPLCVTTTRTFAESWLMPRLPLFWEKHPEIPLAISTEDAVIDLRRSGYHMAIRYTLKKNWPGHEARFLTSGRKVVVGHPDLAAQVDPKGDLIAELEKLPWLIDAQYVDFIAWIERSGIAIDRLNATYLGGNPLVLSGTRSGVGVSTQPRPVVEADLEAGRLVVLMDTREEDFGYYVVTPEGPKPDRVKVFERWLRAEVD